MGAYEKLAFKGNSKEMDEETGSCVQVSASPVCEIPGERIDWLTDSQGGDFLTNDGQIIIVK